MDPYDSDSSLSDGEDFTETSTLLGFASPEIIDDTISHLGGWPVREEGACMTSQSERRTVK